MPTLFSWPLPFARGQHRLVSRILWGHLDGRGELDGHYLRMVFLRRPRLEADV